MLHQTRLAGVPLRVTSGFRSRADQERLWQAWLSGASPYPAAKPGSSRHEVGRAVDVVWEASGTSEPFEGAWGLLGDYAERYLGMRWGGRFRPTDPVHFEDGKVKNG